MTTLENPNAYLLQIDCVATAGNLSKTSQQRINDQVSDLPRPEGNSERTRLNHLALLKEQRVLGHCQLGLWLDSQTPAYQSFKNGPFYIEAAARVLPESEKQNAEHNGVAVEILLTCLYDHIGGLSSYGPSHLPMIVGNSYLISGAGNRRTYLQSIAILTQPVSIPDKEQLESNLQKRITKQLRDISGGARNKLS